MGLSFSVPEPIPIPPSLRNIYNELERDPKIPKFVRPDHGCLMKWAEEGVLLLNATLTVELVYIYRILHELSFQINFYPMSSRIC